MTENPQILSIIETHMGHGTYANLMKEYFSKACSCQVDFNWYNDERELQTRILNRLLSFKFPNQWIQNQDLDFNRFRISIGFAYMARRLVARKLSQAHYSALYLHTQVMALLSVDFMKNLPTVVSIDLTAVQASQEKTDPKFRWTYNPNVLLEKRVYEAAARIITTSEFARKSVIEDYNIDSKKVKAIPFSVKLELFSSIDSSKKAPKTRYNILFIGGDFKRKGGEDVLEVFLTAFSELAELHVVTYTPVECQHPHVHIHRDIKAYSPEWLNLYSQADVFVMPTYGDAFATVFLEAMAAGLPVIASQLPQIYEVVSDGETGFLVPSGDRHALACKIRHLIENPTLGREMGAKGRRVAEQKFNAKTNFQTLESIFKEISISQ
jgi:glycosyltransferase involved in cell wall biosynthesis